MKVSDFVHEMRTTSVVFGRETGVYVTFSGDMAYTDGKRINLPAMGLGNTLTSRQVKTMRGYVDHEAGHVRHSDMPRIIDFYKRCVNNDKTNLKSLHNCIEDVWMEHKVVECYPGSLKNLAQTNESVSEKEIESWEEHGLKVFEDNALNAGFCIKKSNPMYSGGYFEKCMGYYSEDMQKWAAKWAEQAVACKNSEETIELAMAIWKFFEEDKDMSQENPEDFDPKGGDPMESVGEPGDAEAEEGVGKPQKGKKGDGKGQEGIGEDGERVKLPSDYLPDPASVVAQELGKTSDGAGAIGSVGNGDLTGGYLVHDTSEDVTYKRGKENGKGVGRVWDIVNSNDFSEYENVKGRISGSINTMSSKLKRALLAKKRIDRDPGRELGRLDSKRLVAAKTGSRNVFYQRVDRSEEDTAITILVDLSGSMGGRKAEVARDCAVALAECLEGSQMPFKIVGFCNKRSAQRDYDSRGKGRFHRYEPLDTIVFKDYDNTLRTCKGSVVHLDDAVGGNNSDYDFIAQEISILKKRPESRKVLFVLSDGHPAHESDASDSEIIRHCKEAIQDFSKAGGECVGIGICDSAVTKIYKNNVVVNDVNELATTCFTKLSNILIGR